MAVTSTFNPATAELETFGDALDNAIQLSRNAAGTILVNGGAVAVAGGTPTVANTALIEAFGQGGNDVISLSETNGALPASHLFGGTGNDVLTGGSGADQLFGQGDNDTLLGKGGIDFLSGGDGNDTLTGGDADDQMFGEAGDDRMIWNPGDDSDLMEGGADIDTAEVNGGNGDEAFTVTANGSRVRLDRVNPAPFTLDIGTTEKLVVNMNGGNDTFSAAGNLAALIEVIVDGGNGNDTIIGGNGADVLLGGDGNDFIDGNQGSDIALMGAGDDVFQWDPGDGNDTVEGQDGFDTLLFNGANINENIAISANGARARLVRDVANVVMDINDIEQVDVAALGGADNITVNDLSGTDVTKVSIDLAGTIGGTAGDGQIDTVTVSGNNGDDQMSVSGAGTSAAVVGLAALVEIINVEADDRLVINALGGNDSIDASGLLMPVKLTIDGGAGNDTILGSNGADTLLGGDGDDVLLGRTGLDVLRGGAGNDTLAGGDGDDQMFGDAGDDSFVWNPGDDNDVIDGGTGFDRLVFNGANLSEQIVISNDDGFGSFVRNVANVTMLIDKVERIEFKALGGADLITVNDMTGTSVTQIAIDLAGPTGGGDGQPDTIVIDGTNGNDAISLSIVDGKLIVDGLASQIVVENFELDNDTIRIAGLGGDDVIDASGLGVNGPQLVFDGGEGNDILIGSGRADVIAGGAGNDVQIGNAGTDVLDGGTGENIVLQDGSAVAGNVAALFGNNSDNPLTIGRNAAGAIIANGGAVQLPGAPTVANTAVIQVFGKDGNDVITLDETNGALPRAELFGGDGNDTATGGSGADQIFGGAGNDTLLGKGGQDFLFGGDGNDVLTGGDGDDQMFGEAGNDRMVWNPGDDTDLAEGGSGIDIAEVNGGNGGEVFTATANGTRVRFDRVSPAPFSLDIGTTENLVVNMNDGDDSFSATGNLAALISITVDGGGGNDTIKGGNGADVLLGGDGDDFIDGNQGNDVALMGAGDDVFQWDPGDGSDVAEGQGGFDTLLFNGANITENIDIAANGGRVRFVRDVAAITMDLNDVEHISFKGLAGADNIVVKDLSGTDAQRVSIDAGADNDTINASALNAAASLIAQGGAGADKMTGGAGSDTLSYADSALGVNVNLATGAASGGDAAGDVFSFFENIIGSTLADTLTGNAGDNVLTGGAGDDTLDGGAGQDTAVFNLNFASVQVGFAGDKVIIDSAEGHDDLTGFETFQFADGAYRLNDDHTALVAVNPPQPPVTTPPPKLPVNDFDGDGHSDILWQNADGTPAIWLTSGISLVSGANVGFNPGPDWHEIGSGDFDGDGKSDILWQNRDGTIAEWSVNGTSLISGASVSLNPGANTHAIGTGDFNGDGKSDILFQSTDGTPSVWLMDGLNILSAANVGFNPGRDWHAIAAADFDGDGKADILWQNADGTPAVWLMDGTNLLSGSNVGFNPGADWHVVGAGDFNGDSKADILWQNADGTPAVWLMNGTSLIAGSNVGFNPGPDWHAVNTGDYNADGKADILWQNADGTPAVWLMDGTNLISGANVGFNPGSDWHVIPQHHDLFV